MRRVDNGVMLDHPAPSPRWLDAAVRGTARRFADVVCPPGMRAHHRTDRVLSEFELMLDALAPATRRALTAAIVALDQGARLYPRSRGRRFLRLDDQAAEAYVRAMLARRGIAAELVRRIKGLVVMCYYELPEVQREIGYDPVPYIAAVSRRRLASYGPQIRAGETAVTALTEPDQSRARSGRPATGACGPDAGAGVSNAGTGISDLGAGQL
jgi:hypothetical protein